MAIRVKNISQGFIDATGFHPIRAAADYRPGRAGEWKKTKPPAKRKRKATKKRTAKKATKKTAKKATKRTTKRTTVSRKRNPISSKWTPAKVKRLSNGDVQILLTGRKR